MELLVNAPETFVAGIKKTAMRFEGVGDLPQVSLDRVFAYGLQQLLNDAAASAKDEVEAHDMAQARWDNLLAGIVRAARGPTGDPVAREAMKIAIGKVKVHPKYVAWLAASSLKPADKLATDKLADLAKVYATREDIIETAKANVAKVADIEIDEDDLDI